MGIRPYVTISQELGRVSANIAESTMKGIIVGPCIQSEQRFDDKLNLSSSYGTIQEILDAAATDVKVMNVAGLTSGSKLIGGTLNFGAKDARALLEFDGDYNVSIKDAANKHILKVDLTTAGAITIESLLAKGADAGDLITLEYDDGGTPAFETHKIRMFEKDGAELYIHLWNEVTAVSDPATVMPATQEKILAQVKLSLLSPLEVAPFGGAGESFGVDNTSNSTDGGFASKIYVYSPIGDPDGVTFENRHISTVELTTLSNFTKEEVVVRVTDGALYNFFNANRVDLSDNIFEVDETNYREKLGYPSKENKLAYAMKLICAEVPGATMKVYVAKDDTLASYKRALASIATSSLVYSVSVLTDNPEVNAEVVKMVELAGSERVAKWKMAIISERTPHFTQVISLNNYTIVQDGTTDTYIVEAPQGGLLATGATAGDFIFPQNKLDEASDTYYDTYGETYTAASIARVISVITDKKMILEPALPTMNLVDIMAGENMVVGNLNSFDDLSSKIKKSAADISNKDVVSIFPDKAEIVVDGDEVILPSYYLAAVTNGVMAHLPPQQGLSNLSFPSINRVVGSSFTFTDGELDEIASSGIMVFLQDDNSSDPYILRQLTTKMDDLETMEINKVRCLDYATLRLASRLDGYVGKRNVSKENAIDIKDELDAECKVMTSTTDIQYLGPVITSYSVLGVTIPDVESDAINAEVEVSTPTSLNKIRLFVSSAKN